MKQRHSIESAVLNVNFSSEELAQEQQYELEMFARNKMLAVVNEIFDELSDSDEIFRIDKLEIDLGDIGLGYFYDDFSNRLKEKVRESLGGEIASFQQFGNPGSGSIKRIATVDADLAAVCEFLSTGRLPWNAPTRFTSHFDGMFVELLSSRAEELIQFMRTSPAKDRILGRLLNQLSSSNVLAVLARLIRVRGTDVQKLLDEIWPHLGLQASHFARLPDAVRISLLSSLLANYESSSDRGMGLLTGHLIRLAARLNGRSTVQLFLELSTALHGDKQSVLGASVLDALTWASEMSGLGVIEQEKLRKLRRELESKLERRDSRVTAGQVSEAELRMLLESAVQTGKAQGIRSSWKELISSMAPLLVDVVMTEGQRAEVRRSIAHSFPEPWVRDIVRALEPSENEFIERLVAEPKTLLGERQSLAVDDNLAKRSLWEFTLSYLIVERGSRFNRKSYIASVSRQMAAHINVSVTELYDSILTLLMIAQGDSRIKVELMALIGELRSESLGHEARVGSSDGASGSSNSARRDQADKDWLRDSFSGESGVSIEEGFRQSVEALSLALYKGRPAELEKLWPVLHKQNKVWLRSVLQRTGQKADTRHIIASTFNEPLLRAVVKVIEPVAGDYIFETLHSKHLISKRETSARRSRLVVGGRDAYIASWEFTLTYLLVERGSQFNKKSYLASVIQKLAARDNLNVAEFYQSLLLTFGSGQTDNLKLQELVSLLAQLYREATGSEWTSVLRSDLSGPLAADQRKSTWRSDAAAFTAGTESDTGSLEADSLEGVVRQSAPGPDRQGNPVKPAEMEPLELIRAYLLYEKLSEAIAQFGSADGNISYQIVRLLHEMIEHYPWKLHRFNQELNSGRLSLQGVLSKLPRVLQRKLVLAFFKSFERRYAFSTAEFEKRLERLDKTHSQKPRTTPEYLQILERLIGNRVVDIDQIFSQTGSRERDHAVSSTMEEQRIADRDREFELAALLASREAGREQSSVERLQTFLSGGQQASSFDKSSLLTSVELMLNSQPAELADLLKRLLTAKSAADRLVAMLPESLLVKILLLLRPADHFKAILYADLLTMASVQSAAAPQLTDRELHRRKWEFIFDFLIIRRQMFSEVSYVRQFSEMLLDQTVAGRNASLEDKQQFFARLTESLRSTSSPSTHVAGVRIAMIIGNLISDTSIRNAGEPGTALESKEQDKLERLYKASQTEQSVRADSATPFDFEEHESDILEEVYVENAGLVLLSPYLPRYFDMVGLMEGRNFKDRAHAERGVHLLQYLLNDSTENFEYQLVLNKVLCGVRAGIPICKGIEITEQEKTCSGNLLQGVLQNWPALKNTSVEGLRESFLQRKAHLQLKDDAWHLQVESKAFDMLLDGVPWNYGTIKHPWMERPIYVHWR
jgi:hypothetical protein